MENATSSSVSGPLTVPRNSSPGKSATAVTALVPTPPVAALISTSATGRSPVNAAATTVSVPCSHARTHQVTASGRRRSHASYSPTASAPAANSVAATVQPSTPGAYA